VTYPLPQFVNTVGSGGTSTAPFLTIFQARNPTTSDLAYPISKRWVNTTTEIEWILRGFTSTGGVVQADWIALTSPIAVIDLTGNTGGPVGPDGSGNINVVGDGTTITIAGNPATHTLTASLIGGLAAIEEFLPDSGTSPVVPNGSGQVTMAGSGSTTTVGGLNTLTFELTGLTSHNVLVGAGTTTITKVAPSATSGVPFISQGAAADPAFGTAVVAGGGTGDTSFTAYAPVCGGTTSTGALQSATTGFSTANFVLTSNGNAALPSWQNVSASGAITTLSDDVGTTITPLAGNIQLVGHVVEQGATKFSTVVAGTHLANINPMSSARWIVDPLGFNGTHTTIASAITSSTSGDTILLLPGVYTENLTLKAGVNLAAFSGDDDTPNVTITGKATLTTAGTVCISNIRLQTNSDFFLVVSGSSASVINLENCYLNCSNNTGISHTSSNSSSSISMKYCFGDLGTTGITFFVSTSAGNVYLFYSTITNSGSSTVASSVSVGSAQLYYSLIAFPMSTSGTGSITSSHSNFGTNNINATSLTTAGSGLSSLSYTIVEGGSASAASIGVGTTIVMYNCIVISSNTNALTGSGALQYGDVTFLGSSSQINVTTQVPFPFPVKQGGTGASAFTAYMPVCGGTTSTGAFQSVSTGTAGYVLTYNSSASLPTWQSVGALSIAYTNVNSSPYTVLTTDYYLSVDCSGGAITLNFPNSPTANQRWVVKDRTGSAHTHNITLSTPGGTVTFDGSTSYVMSVNYGAVDLIANATPTYEIY